MIKNFSLKITGEGLSIDKTVDFETVNKIVNIIFPRSEASPPQLQETMKTVNTSVGVKKSRQRKTKIRTQLLRPEIEDIILDPNAKGYKSYWNDLRTKADRALWLLVMAKNKGVEEMTTSEISRLARKVNDDIQAKNVKGILLVHSKAGRLVMDIKKGSLVLRVLEAGVRFISNGGVAE